MKKIFNLFILMNLIFGVVFLFNSNFVLADPNQGINASISPNVSLFLNPRTVEFGAIVPGTINNSATSGNITFNANGSNVNISIATTVTGEPFASGLKFGGALAHNHAPYIMVCIISGGICTYNLLTIVPTLSVPVGSPAGAKTGVITYTITYSSP